MLIYSEYQRLQFTDSFILCKSDAEQGKHIHVTTPPQVGEHCECKCFITCQQTDKRTKTNKNPKQTKMLLMANMTVKIQMLPCFQYDSAVLSMRAVSAPEITSSSQHRYGD